MKYPEETYAEELQALLSAACPEAKVTISGAGVHWQCDAVLGNRRVQAYCFEQREYSATWSENEFQLYGRTRNQPRLVEAAACWLNGAAADVLLAAYSFIEFQRRRLTKLAADLTAICPDLSTKAKMELQNSYSENCELFWDTDSRSCRIYYYGREKLPRIQGSWDKTQMFQIQQRDWRQLSLLLQRWLCENAAPSQLEKEFPWLEMDPIAAYYENGNPIEGEFLLSWQHIRNFYNEEHARRLTGVLPFLDAMRAAGYDSSLRAGQSMWTLILSRSRRHGLHGNQASISFDFGRTDMKVEATFDGETHSFRSPIALTPEVEDVLEELASRDVDTPSRSTD